MKKEYAYYAANKTIELLNIDSPTGFTKEMIKKIEKDFKELGYVVEHTNKGALLIKISDGKDGLLLEAHGDTLGAMVKEIKNNGRLKMTPLGGLVASNIESENVRVYSRFNKT